jgi:hypothetical protein
MELSLKYLNPAIQIGASCVFYFLFITKFYVLFKFYLYYLVLTVFVSTLCIFIFIIKKNGSKTVHYSLHHLHLASLKINVGLVRFRF